MKHKIPLGTRVSFGVFGHSRIYVVDSYSDLHLCSENCSSDHDHFTEPHLTVCEETWTTMPLSKLETIYDNKDCYYLGRKPTKDELEPSE
jgi:hypothetical protein